MAEQPPLHRLYHHYSELPYSVRVLYTAALLVLGLGYMFALIYVFHTYAGRGTGNKMMLSYEDLVVAYSGSGHGSRLELALQGPMSNMLPAEDGKAIIAWVKEGADQGNLRQEHQADPRQALHGLPRRQQPASSQSEQL